MESEHSRSFSNLRSMNLKNYKTDPQSRRPYKVNSEDRNLQCMFDLHSLEAQLTRILHPVSDLGVKKRAASVENAKNAKLGKLVDLQKYELRRKVVNPLKSRIELKPLMLSKSKDQSKEGYSNIIGVSTQREIIPSDTERNPYLPHSRMNSIRSVPQTNCPSGIPSPKESTMEVTKLLELEREKRESIILPKIKKEFSPHDLVFAPNVKPEIVKPHVFKIIQGIFYATRRVKPLPLSQLQSKLVELGPLEGGKKTLVLDLDETLIFARRKDLPDKPPNDGNETENAPMRVKIRPHAIDFIREMSKIFEIVIFTAAEKIYAGLMVKLLDPDQKYVKHILHRDHCLKTLKGLYLKDLRIIKDRNLKDVIIVDNFTPSFAFQLENGIPIITWQGDTSDRELKYLTHYLNEASRYDDVRVYNKEKLRLRELPDLPSEKLTELQNIH